MELHQSGITGRGVAIAVIDSGFWQKGRDNLENRIVASVDITDVKHGKVKSDVYGHGTHIRIGGGGNSIHRPA